MKTESRKIKRSEDEKTRDQRRIMRRRAGYESTSRGRGRRGRREKIIIRFVWSFSVFIYVHG